MPTPILIDGFEHQVKIDTAFLLDDWGNLWGTIEGAANITFPAGRNGLALQVAPAGAACRGIKVVNSPTVLVTSFYFKTSSTPASQDSAIARVLTTAFNNVPVFFLRLDGKIRAQVGASTVDTAAAYNDGVWHRIDTRANVSSNPWVIDWQIDGVAQTGFSPANAANTLHQVEFGTSTTDTYTCQYDDLVCSVTSADYPLGAHDVLYGVPTGDGTHNAGTNTIENQAGTDITSPNAFPVLDELPPTTADYIQQATIGSGNYAEVTFADQPAGKTIWGVEGLVSLFSSGTAANTGTTRIVDASNTTLTDIYSGNMADTNLNYRKSIITAPAGGWDGAGYQGVKARVGFSTDVTDVPRWAALLLQYAVTTSAGVPTGLTATAVSSSQINLNWDDYAGATGYDIERNGVVVVSDNVPSAYNDTGLTASTLYTYRVRAVL